MFDVVILGGGVSGLGVALAAEDAGLSAALVEERSLASATSNNSLRILHGGLRYLQSLELPRIIESLVEQDYWRRRAAKYTRPLECFMPLSSCGLKSRWPVALAAQCYECGASLLGIDVLPVQVLSRKDVREKLLWAPREDAKHFLRWHDVLLTDPEGFHSFLSRKLLSKTHVFTGHKALQVQHSKNEARIDISGGDRPLSGKIVVNTLGPWIDSLRVSPDISAERPKILWSRAFNIVFQRSSTSAAAISSESAEGRMLFALPRDEKIVVGTWYLPAAGVNDRFETIQKKELSVAVDEVNEVFPEAKLSLADVDHVDFGVVPLRAAGPPPKFFGQERILEVPGYIEVLSTKYTVFRAQGMKVIQRVLKQLRS